MAELPWYVVLQYAGRDFAGWQLQPAARTVQGEVERVLARLAGTAVRAHAAGRTDAGVHALGQVISFTLPRPWAAADLTRALNALLPNDVWVSDAHAAPAGFHARKDAVARRYRYVLGCDRASASPFRRPFEWALQRAVDAAALEQGARTFLGEHDFRGLSAVGQIKPHYRCRVTHAQWAERPNAEGYIFTVEADRFLHRMVRFMVALMVDVALGRRVPEDIPRQIAAEDNTDASPPAPPEGLFLESVRYPHLAKGA